ncbi:hypothetical protein, partial [Hymenobacter rubripertinctus]|uniref:hypothetical protein n=1 Tax=Hymenobacter rubripertinctus TaxID=2029981 RepID=UPI001C71EC61
LVAAGFALVFGLAVAAAVLAQVSTAALATRQRGLKHGSKILLTPHYTTARFLLPSMLLPLNDLAQQYPAIIQVI